MTKGKTEKKRFIVPMETYNQLKDFEFQGSRITGSTVSNFVRSKPEQFPNPEEYIILEMF